MVGSPDASWHLELVHEQAAPVESRPTEDPDGYRLVLSTRAWFNS